MGKIYWSLGTTDTARGSVKHRFLSFLICKSPYIVLTVFTFMELFKVSFYTINLLYIEYGLRKGRKSLPLLLLDRPHGVI